MTVIKLKKVTFYISLVLLIAVCVATACMSRSYAVFFNGTTRLIPIYCVDREDKTLSISFDCAWGTEYTQSILDTLNNTNTPATFFMVEFWTVKYPELVKKIDESGCEIGTHSSTHSYMSKLDKEHIEMELSTSCKAIEDIIGKKVELFRPPYGDYDNQLIATVSQMGLYTIQWDVDSLDWKNLSATDIALRVINKAKSGSIILMHNNGLHTAEALPIIISTLKNKGYTFVPIGELIYKNNYTVDGTGKQIQSK